MSYENDKGILSAIEDICVVETFQASFAHGHSGVLEHFIPYGREKKRQKRDGNVTVTAGSREQGTGNRDETEERQEEPPALPPADHAERAIKQTTDALRTRLYALVTELEREDPKHRDPTELMRLVTAYDKPGGGRVKGVVNAHLLTHERVEKSIADAEAILADWRQKRGA